MSQNIHNDWFDFRRIIGGKFREELKKHIDFGKIFRLRDKDGKHIAIPLPRINQPHIVFGNNGEGTGAGEGKEGDVVKKGKKKGKGDGPEPGNEAGEGINIWVDKDEILKLLKEELQLPELLPKPNQTFEEKRTIYNGISKTGPSTLLHKSRTVKQCMKRLASMGMLRDDKKKIIPGFKTPVTVLSPINDDKRFRQYNEISIPSSNAVIFFLRDGSASMGDTKCDIASDIAWWIKLYIQHYYKRTETCFIWHDTEARELDEKNFFSLREGGGTYASSALTMMDKIITDRYPTEKWNIYGIYFGDGETSSNDNEEFVKMLRTKLGPNVVNMFGQVEILSYMGERSLKSHLDREAKKGGMKHLRNTEIKNSTTGGDPWSGGEVTGEYRDAEVKRVIQELLGKNAKATESRQEETASV